MDIEILNSSIDMVELVVQGVFWFGEEVTYKKEFSNYKITLNGKLI